MEMEFADFSAYFATKIVGYGKLPVGNFVYLTRWQGQLMSA